MNPNCFEQAPRQATVELREARPDDTALLPAIFNAARAAAGCFSGPDVDLEGLKSLTEGERVYVAEIEGQVVGFASVWVPDSFVHHLYVLPQLHGQGVGSRLLAFCEERHRPLSLKCELANEAARRFYLNRGWSVRERGAGDEGLWERWYSPRG